MVRITARLLKDVTAYWNRYKDRCMNLRTKPDRYVCKLFTAATALNETCPARFSLCIQTMDPCLFTIVLQCCGVILLSVYLTDLRGWVGEDLRADWVHTDDAVFTQEARMVNIGKRRKLLQEELLEPIKDWTVLVGDRVSSLISSTSPWQPQMLSSVGSTFRWILGILCPHEVFW